jgi:hypothetical protein
VVLGCERSAVCVEQHRRQEGRAEMKDLVTAVGSVMLTEGGLLLVPTGPPSTDEPYDPFHGPHGDPESEFALSLSGPDLPSAGQRAAVTGSLSGRAMQVDHWRTEPIATSPWAVTGRCHEPGVEPDVAHAILDGVPDEWPIIECGATTSTSGGHIATLTVDRVTNEMRDWLSRQPEGAVRLSSFIVDIDRERADAASVARPPAPWSTGAAQRVR